MARYAQKCIYQHEKGYFSSIKWVSRRIRFEYQLFKTYMHLWMIRVSMKILSGLKLSSDASKLLDFDYDLDNKV